MHCAEWELFISFAKIILGTFLFEWKFPVLISLTKELLYCQRVAANVWNKTSPHFSFPNAECYDLFKMDDCPAISRAAEVFLRYCIVVVDLSLQR